jgi:hypothetical protein
MLKVALLLALGLGAAYQAVAQSDDFATCARYLTATHSDLSPTKENCLKVHYPWTTKQTETPGKDGRREPSKQ